MGNVGNIVRSLLPGLARSETSESFSEKQVLISEKSLLVRDGTTLAAKARKERERTLHFMKRFAKPKALQAKAEQSPCAQITHPRWASISSGLSRYVRGRMDKGLAQDQHLGVEHHKQQGGICYGMSAVWLRLHHAKPSASASRRLDLMMSENATIHATIAQRLYSAEWDDYEFQTASSPQNAIRGSAADLHTELVNASDLYSSRATPVSKDFFQGEKAYAKLGSFLKNSPGYFHLPIELAGPGKSGTHAFSVVSEGRGHPLTIFDSNLGECRVPPKELGRFIKEMSAFYQSTRGIQITGVSGVQRIDFIKPIDETPLGPMAKELD